MLTMYFRINPIMKLLAATLALASTVNAGSDNVKRDQTCSITSSDGVKCRSCPYISCDVVTVLPAGDKLGFSSYAVGDCYENNCTWDYTPEHKCYVNGYYTSNNCNHNDLPLTVLSTTRPSTPTATSPRSTSSSPDTSFGPTTSFNPAATATSSVPQSPTTTSGSSNKLSGIGVGIVSVVISTFLML